jgi:acyl carrier protein
LYIAGEGLARGYLNRPGLTAERFLPELTGAHAGSRMYRTGDVVRRLADGSVEFIGRADDQVKVRGFRIELGEIEAALLAHESVREAAAVVREDVEGDKRVVAYVAADVEGKVVDGQSDAAGRVTAAELRTHLKERLPEYMVPSAFVLLERLPVTPNGKLDRKALPAPEAGGRSEGVYVAPRTPIEETLAEIWREVLGVERVGVEDDFFDLGGHSLLATQVMSRVREAFTVEVALRGLFERPTVAGLGVMVEEALIAKMEELTDEEAEGWLDKAF